MEKKHYEYLVRKWMESIYLYSNNCNCGGIYICNHNVANI